MTAEKHRPCYCHCCRRRRKPSIDDLLSPDDLAALMAESDREGPPKATPELLVSYLQEQPELARHLAAHDVAEVLASCELDDLTFGDETDAAALPLETRRVWLHLDIARWRAASAAHDSNLPSPSTDRAVVSNWLQKSGELHRKVHLIHKQLIAVNAHF